MNRVKIRIDDREIDATEGETVLDAALRNEIFIPHLCYRPGSDEAFAGCRLCFIEVEGKGAPVTSCTEPAREGMVVRTDTEPALRLQRSALRLLLFAHEVDCKNCPENRNCRLQDLVLALKVKGLRNLSTHEPLDRTLVGNFYDKNKCVL